VQQGFLALGQPCPVSHASRRSGQTDANSPRRHRRTHEPRPDGEPLSDYNEDELEGEDDQLHSLEEDSPGSTADYLTSAHGVPVSYADIPGPGLAMGSMNPHQQLMAGSHY
jgi:transcription factor STE12